MKSEQEIKESMQREIEYAIKDLDVLDDNYSRGYLLALMNNYKMIFGVDCEEDTHIKTPETQGSMLTIEEAIRYTNWQTEDYRELARTSFNANEREKSWKYSSKADYNHQLNLWLRELKMLKEKKE